MLFYSSPPPSEAGTSTPVQRRRDCWPLRREVMTSSAPAWQDDGGGEGPDLRDTEQQSLQDSVWVRGLRARGVGYD